MRQFVAEFELPLPTHETLTLCGEPHRALVYTINAEDVKPALKQLTRDCISGAVLRLHDGVGMLHGSQISGQECGARGLSISLVGKPSTTSTAPSTRLVLRRRNIGISYGASVCIQDIILQWGRAESGGALWVVGAKLRMHRSRIENCEADRLDAGAILIQQSVAVLTNCYFVNNKAQKRAGALTIEKSTALVTGCMFERNHASNAGAIHIQSSRVTLDSTIFSSNAARGDAGAISYAQTHAYAGRKALLLLNSCTLVNNTSAGHGGAIYVEAWHPTNRSEASALPSVELNDCRILSNTAGHLQNISEGTGGGVHVRSGHVAVKNCELSGNFGDRGGAIAAWPNEDPLHEDPYIWLSACSLRHNIAKHDGGAIYSTGTAHIKSTCILNNEVPH